MLTPSDRAERLVNLTYGVVSCFLGAGYPLTEQQQKVLRTGFIAELRQMQMDEREVNDKILQDMQSDSEAYKRGWADGLKALNEMISKHTQSLMNSTESSAQLTGSIVDGHRRAAICHLQSVYPLLDGVRDPENDSGPV